MLLAFTKCSHPVIHKVAVHTKPKKMVMLCGVQALMSIINDTLGTPLFDTRMAALQLPMSATIRSITDYPDESITDQIDSVRPHHRFHVWQIVLIVLAASLGVVAMVLSTVVWGKKRQKQQSGRNVLASQVYCSLLAACLLDKCIFTYGATHDSRTALSLLLAHSTYKLSTCDAMHDSRIRCTRPTLVRHCKLRQAVLYPTMCRSEHHAAVW